MRKQTYFTIDDLVNLINEPDFQEIIKYAEKLEYNDKAKAYKVTYEDEKHEKNKTTSNTTKLYK